MSSDEFSWVACKGDADLALLRVGRWAVEFDATGKPSRMRPIIDAAAVVETPEVSDEFKQHLTGELRRGLDERLWTERAVVATETGEEPT